MVKLIVGKKGSGKTKAMLESVNNAVDIEHGNVVFIARENRHTFDINHGARLVGVAEGGMADFSEFRGFIKGIMSQNYDITHIYIDSILKIVADGEGLVDFINTLDSICQGNDIKFTITISAAKEELPEAIYKFIA
ncbi:MAG: hypothetical protein E7416_00265 [Ruminococcaceae bacterium]|nr:hypothetical protein [Oscillospiraceae bacterium]